MERFIHKKADPNEIPIIFVRDTAGNIQKKVSVNEWTNRYSPASLDLLEIKLYRQALTYYSEQDYEKAIDLLKFLIIQTGYTHFEYIERLATIYRKTHAEALEYQLLSSVLASAEIIGLPAGLIKKLERRIDQLKLSMARK
ncbi:hypothetical protein [Enterococcus mundtii]|uniref:Uncharacterized protein n=1 Tax=Enterococcus mundtii TaxID=53346 RepID=A0A1L8UMN4_ENTMU|nr:hypothetical protein [Enterococcus mundtii]GEN19788.1 hypothetical protein LAC02_30690 [Ligilactobacillus acidipiscis]AUB52499.1 hypothetical protein EM4838_05720 [Enterococcus mundtii]MDB7088719.1 hypothetical protein [Enterococcus mundtii]MZZ57941.1 hypothetical protein [Enterococcus mundtii]MZZ60916.1 hypothetical protein [Enterococcus mundtii]